MFLQKKKKREEKERKKETMNFILRIWVPSTLLVVAQYTKILTIRLDLTSDIKAIYISRLGSQSSQDWEFMQMKVVRFIFQLTVVNRIINLTAV